LNKQTQTNNIISQLNIYANKSFQEFLGSFYNFKSFSNNILETEEFFIFDSIKPSLNISLLKQHLTLQNFYKQSKKEKRLDNIICLYFYKYKTITKLKITKEDETIEIHNSYKEYSRQISYPRNNDFTHLLTITYRHKNNLASMGILERTQYSKIFEIMKDNEAIRERIKRGIHRLRNYIRKKIKDALKKKIRNKKLLNKEINRLKDIIFKYFKVHETHASGHLHTHILIKLPKFITNLDFKEIIKKMAVWFETESQGIDLKRLKKSKDKNRAKRYVLKYMFKQFNNDNVFYVENEKKEKIYFIRKDAIIKNDIPRLISKSRNVKTERFKPNFKFKREKNKEKQKEKKEATRTERELIKRHYGEFKEILKDFRTTKEKILEFEIEKAEKRTEKLEKLKDFLKDKYYSIRDILHILDDFKDDEIIQERYKELYLNTIFKFNRLLDDLEEERQEEIETVNF
jgi:hypothetical protein